MSLRRNALPAPAPRLTFIEGLRGYLAFWVVICHVLWACGIQASMLSGIPKLLRMGEYAVDVFIAVSGFVIFMLLDSQKVTYTQFIVRRFFRLFPLFIVLFVAAIPLSLLTAANAVNAAQYLAPDQVQALTASVQSWWDNLGWHVPLHATMLHGLIPNSLVPNAPGAFLIPAWSVSLEWQFYLVAPLAYAMAVSSNRLVRIALVALCAALFLLGRGVLPRVDYGAALPFLIEYFFLGAVSYFIYKHRPRWIRPAAFLVVGCVLGGLALADGRLSWTIPAGLWIAFLGAILERRTAPFSVAASYVFANRVSLHLGRISYSVYLSHILVITVLQSMLLEWLPHLTLTEHFVLLLGSTIAVTVAVSTFLHAWLEAPGINLGRIVAQRLAERRAEPEADEGMNTGRWRMLGQRVRRRWLS